MSDLVADQAAITTAIPVIYEEQEALPHAPLDQPRSRSEQQEQQQQSSRGETVAPRENQSPPVVGTQS